MSHKSKRYPLLNAQSLQESNTIGDSIPSYAGT